MLDLAQDVAHGTMSREPQVLVLRARELIVMRMYYWMGLTFHEETRKTYRAVFSEPRLVIPNPQPPVVSQPVQETCTNAVSTPTPGTKRPFDDIGDGKSRNPSKTEGRSNKKRKNKQR